MRHSRPRGGAAFRGLLAGLLVVVLGGAVVWWFLGRDDAQLTREKHKASPAQIAEATPAVVSNVASAAVVTTNSVRRTVKNPTKTYFDENGIERYPGGARVPRKNPKLVTFPDRRAVKWQYFSEDEICTLLQMEPGDAIIGDDYSYGPKFVADFKESLKTPIVIADDDDWYQRQLKEGMIAAKLDLSDALARGEDISEIMANTRKQMRELFEYKEELEAQVSSIVHNGEYTEKDIKDLTDAANKMLSEKGIPPIRMSRMVARRLAKKKSQQAENSAAQEKAAESVKSEEAQEKGE